MFPDGNENFRSLRDFGSFFLVRAGHNRRLRTLLPASVADLAEASRIEGQSLDGPLGGLGHSPLGAGLPVVSQILRYLRIYLWLKVTRQHASLGHMAVHKAKDFLGSVSLFGMGIRQGMGIRPH